MAVRNGQIVRRGEFFWPVDAVSSSGGLNVTPGRPSPGDPARPIDQIAPEEIRAAELIVAESYQMPHETLVQETARWLGYRRITERILTTIDAVLASTEDLGKRAG